MKSENKGVKGLFQNKGDKGLFQKTLISVVDFMSGLKDNVLIRFSLLAFALSSVFILFWGCA